MNISFFIKVRSPVLTNTIDYIELEAPTPQNQHNTQHTNYEKFTKIIGVYHHHHHMRQLGVQIFQ